MKRFVSLLLALLLTLGALLLLASAADAVVYLDGVAGNDANDGLSAAAPKKKKNISRRSTRAEARAGRWITPRF